VPGWSSQVESGNLFTYAQTQREHIPKKTERSPESLARLIGEGFPCTKPDYIN
jgi:hypothetical protein